MSDKSKMSPVIQKQIPFINNQEKKHCNSDLNEPPCQCIIFIYINIQSSKSLNQLLTIQIFNDDANGLKTDQTHVQIQICMEWFSCDRKYRRRYQK